MLSERSPNPAAPLKLLEPGASFGSGKLKRNKALTGRSIFFARPERARTAVPRAGSALATVRGKERRPLADPAPEGEGIRKVLRYQNAKAGAVRPELGVAPRGKGLRPYPPSIILARIGTKPFYGAENETFAAGVMR